MQYLFPIVINRTHVCKTRSCSRFTQLVIEDMTSSPQVQHSRNRVVDHCREGGRIFYNIPLKFAKKISSMIDGAIIYNHSSLRKPNLSNANVIAPSYAWHFFPIVYISQS